MTLGQQAPIAQQAQTGHTVGFLGARPNKWEVFGIVAVGVFMANLDTSIVNVSLPAIAKAFGTTLSGPIEWVVIAYLMVVASLLLTVGWLSDRVGRRRLWAIGLTLFTLGSSIGGAAPLLAVLIVARGLQGVGAAFLLALGPALLSDAFPRNERGRVSGLNAITVALGASAGPILGGLLTQWLTWRWIFYINVPLGCLGLLLSWRLPRRQAPIAQPAFDLGGTLSLTIGLGALTVALSFGKDWGWASPAVLVLLAISGLAVFGLALAERHAAAPIITASLFRQRVFLTALLSLIVFYLAIFSVNLLMPFYLEVVRHLPAGQVGLLLIPAPLSLALVAPVTGRLSDRIGSRVLTAGGLALVAIGLLLLCLLGTHGSLWQIEWRLALIGVGQAIFISPNNGAILKSAPDDKLGIAAGALATGRTIGQSMSVALAGAIFANAGGTAAGHLLMKTPTMPTVPPAIIASAQQIFLHGLQAAFLVSAGIAALGVVIALGRGEERVGARTPQTSSKVRNRYVDDDA